MPTRTSSRPPERLIDTATGNRVPVALAVAGLAAILVIVAVVKGVVPGQGPAYPSAALLVLLALMPVVVAASCVSASRTALARGVLAGAGAVAAGRALIDLQIVMDPTVASRPEFLVPGRVEVPSSWAASALVACDVLAVVAGIVAGQSSYEDADRRTPFGSRRRLASVATAIAAVLAFGVMGKPFGSDNPSVPGDAPLNGSLIALLGCVLLAGAVLAAIAMAAGADSWQVTRGVFVGVAAGAFGLVAPWIVGALTVSWLHLTIWPCLVVLAAVALVAVAAAPASEPRAQAVPTPRTASVPADRPAAQRLRTPGRRPKTETKTIWRTTVWFPVAGVVAVAAGAVAVAAANTTFLQVNGQAVAHSGAQEMMLPAGVVVAVMGVAMLVPGIAPLVRPALSCAWVALVLVAAGAVAQPAAAAVTMPGLPAVSSDGPGVGLTVAAVVAAVVAGLTSAIGGIVEREDVDPDEQDAAGVFPAAIAGVLAVGAFVLPVVDEGVAIADGFDVATGGATVALIAVVVACATAPHSRPVRAAALLAGAAVVVALRLAEIPYADVPVVASGAWCAGGCLIALAVTAGVRLTAPVR